MIGISLISVIIPAYNCQEWICDAIDSVLNQTYPNHEIIVIDDGSSDGTKALLEECYGETIRYIYQENKGLAAARNRGLDEAKGSYIQFLDCDDIISPEKFEAQLNSIKDDEGLVLSISDYYSCDIDDIDKERSDRYLSPAIVNDDPIIDLISRWETEFSIPVHCFLFDASFFKFYGIRFDETLPNHEDWDCWMRIFSMKPTIKYVDRKCAIYRISSRSMCYDFKAMKYGYLKAIQQQIHLLKHDKKMVDLLSKKRASIDYIRHYKNVKLEETPHAVDTEFADDQDRLIVKWDQLLAERDRQLLAQDQQILALSMKLLDLEQKLSDSNRLIPEYNKQLSEQEHQLSGSQRKLTAEGEHTCDTVNPYSWKITAPLRKIYELILRVLQR